MDRSLYVKFEAFLLTEKMVSKNTFAAYKSDIDQLALFLTKKQVAVEALTTSLLREFVHHLSKQGVGARSLARKLSSLKVFFMFLHERCGIPIDVHDVEPPKLEKKLPQYFSEKEIERLLLIADEDSSIIGRRNKVMLYLLYVTGMRVSELVNLTIENIKFDSGLLIVTGKGGKERFIPLPDYMCSLLKEYIVSIRPLNLKKDDKFPPVDSLHLFPVVYGGEVKPISRQSFWIILNNLWRLTGSQQSISPHKLRHSLATHMLKNGANLRSLQLLLGHENLTTVQVYTHLETKQLRSIYDKKHPRS